MSNSDERFAGVGFLSYSVCFLIIYLVNENWLVEYKLLSMALVVSASACLLFAVLYVLMATFEYRRMREYAQKHLSRQSPSWSTATIYALGTVFLVVPTVATQDREVVSVLSLGVPAAGTACFLFSQWNLRRTLKEGPQEHT